MADQTLIPPVNGSWQVPKNRPVPASRERKKSPPEKHGPGQGSDKKDDDQHSIDEYA